MEKEKHSTGAAVENGRSTADEKRAESEDGIAVERAGLPPWVYRSWLRDAGDPGEKRAVLAVLEEMLMMEISASGLQASLCLYDYAANGWIALGADRLLYPASMIKTLLLLTALEKAAAGDFLLDERHRLAESDKYAGATRVTGTGILQFAPAGSAYTFEELLALMMGRSDNVATNIVFDQLGADSCAVTAQRLGLKESAFTRKMYDLESGFPSNRATAFELTQMLLALQDRKAAGEALTRKGIAMLAAATDKDRIGRYIGERAVVANKVGTVSGVVGDMALIYFPGRAPLALTVVVENSSDSDEASAFIGKLAEMIVEMLQG